MAKLLTQKQFLKKSKVLHGKKYDYSKSIYINSKTHIKIICKIHGEFSQKAGAHLEGQGCINCKYDKSKLTKKEFVIKAKKKFGNYFNYSKVDLSNGIRDNKLTFVCPIHGEFTRDGQDFLSSDWGCYDCWVESPIYLSGKKRGKKRKEIKRKNNRSPKPLTQKEFLKRAEVVHGSKYDYSKVNYTKSNEKIIFICKIHGEKKQRASAHLDGQGCIDCKNEITLAYSKEEIIRLFKKQHGKRYDYSNVIYFKYRNKVNIICKKHNFEFKQTPELHIRGRIGCKKCKGELFAKHTKLTKKEIFNRIEIIHGKKYIYPKFEYKSIRDKIKIICKKHGPFEQTLTSHIDNYSGCPVCKESSGENFVRLFLIKKNIKYINEWNDHDCIYKNKLRFDFYLPDLKTVIEYDGQHHFKPIRFFGGINHFKETQKRDKIKNNWLKKNKIKLIRVKYSEKNIHKYLSKRIH